MDKLVELGKIWALKIESANRVYEAWADKFKTRQILDFYEGFQWGDLDVSRYTPYALNLIRSSMEVKLPSMLMENPRFTISPKIMFESDNVDIAEARAQLKQEAVNTIIAAEDLEFDETIELVFLSAYISFGVCEVNYDADWIKNDRASKPALKSDQDTIAEPDGKTVNEPEYIPQTERIFIKYINPQRFRVSAINTQKTERCDWCGYYEYIRIEDLKANKSYKQPKNITAYRSEEFTTDMARLYANDEQTDIDTIGDVTKVWFLWDHRTKKHIVFGEADSHIYKIDDYDIHPIHDLRMSRRLSGWYPIPPIFDWLSPQTEYNESREMSRAHRRRAVRKLLAIEGMITKEEVAALEEGGDGHIGWAKNKGALEAVPNPPAGQDVNTSLALSKEDFNIISGTSAEARLQGSGGTATEAAITDKYAQVRDSKARKKAAKYLNNIARSIVKIISSQFVLPVLVESFAHDDSGLFDEVQALESVWKEVKPEDLDGEDYKVSVQVESMSPIANEEQKKSFLEFMAVINNYPQIAMSPALIKKTAEILGFKDRKILRELQQAALLALMQQKQQAMGNALAQRQTEASTPNTQAQIESQLGTQVGMGQ